MSLSGPMLFDPRGFWGDENVRFMTEREVCAYLRLLSHQWEEGSIPSDPSRVAALLTEGVRVVTVEDLTGKSKAGHQEAPLEVGNGCKTGGMWRALSVCFEACEGDRLRNKRTASDRDKWLARKESDRKYGRMGGLQKAANKRLATPPLATLEAPSSHPLPYPSPSPLPSPSPNKKREGVPTKKKAKKVKKSEPVFEMPDVLADLSEFNDFIEHRKQIGSPLTQLAGDRLLAKLARYGPKVALEAINASIENGWKGVFPDKLGKQAAAARPGWRLGPDGIWEKENV